MLRIKEVEMVDSLDELKSSKSVSGNEKSKFRDAECEDFASALKKDHPKFSLQEEGQSRKSRKRTGFHEEDRSPS